MSGDAMTATSRRAAVLPAWTTVLAVVADVLGVTRASFRPPG
jgi:hypothetical protein